jgi:hypothetical protein
MTKKYERKTCDCNYADERAIGSFILSYFLPSIFCQPGVMCDPPVSPLAIQH